MAEPLDLDRLLAPFPEGGPSDSLEGADTLSALKEARITARREEKKIEPDRSLVIAAWRKVEQSATDMLATRSKHLDVAVYLTEALLRLRGFAGLRDGFRLMRGLCERFWEDLQPRLDGEDGPGGRFLALTQLNGEDRDGTLIAPLLSTPLSRGAEPIDQASFLGYTMRAGEAERKKLLAKMEQAVAETDPEFFVVLRRNLDQCLEELEHLGRLLREKAAAHTPKFTPPPTSRILETLEQCRNTVRILTKEPDPGGDAAAASQPEPEPDVALAEPPLASPLQKSVTADGRLNNREDALRILDTVADFFRRTEPHSPISYSLEQAVRWGGMPLHELIGELIGDEKARQNFCRLTGIPMDSKG